MYKECSYERCGNTVFSRGICRKHYEIERLENAPTCTEENCDKKVYRGTLCSTHYRANLLATHPKCIVPNCNDPQKVLSTGLCSKHQFRFSRHGSVEQPRDIDWGARESHPLYQTYHWQRRRKIGMCEEWLNDFWEFVRVVGDRPDNHSLRRIDETAVMGPDNWYWKERFASADKAVYAREWRKRNPERVKNSDLKKQFGISLAQYESMLEAQDHKCAICRQHEDFSDTNGIPIKMAVDHCHKTGKVRKLLCSRCNKALGGFRDDPELLLAAAMYVEEHR